MTSGCPLDRRCQGVAVARCFEGYAPRQNVRSFERAAIRQIPMALAWSPAKAPVQHIISTTRIKRFRIEDFGVCNSRVRIETILVLDMYSPELMKITNHKTQITNKSQ